MKQRPKNIPADAQELIFFSAPQPLLGAEAHAAAMVRAQAPAARISRALGEHKSRAAHVERCKGKGESYDLSPIDRDNWLRPPSVMGDGSTVLYDAILTRAGVYEFKDAKGAPMFILKPPKILEAASWKGVPVLLGPDHPKLDEDPESPYMFDLDAQEARLVGSVIEGCYLDKWMLWDAEEDLAWGRLAISTREGREYVKANPYVSTGYRSFIIAREGVWGDGDDEDDYYTHEFVWIDPIHLTITPSPRSGSVTQVRTESAHKSPGMARLRESRHHHSPDPYAAALRGILRARPLAESTAPRLAESTAPRLAESSRAAESSRPNQPQPSTPPRSMTPMSTKQITVGGITVEASAADAHHIHNTLQAKETEIATLQGRAAVEAKGREDADKARAAAEAVVAAKDAEIATLKASVTDLNAKLAAAQTEARAAKEEGPVRLRLIRALGQEAKATDDALPLHDLRLRVVDTLGMGGSLPTDKRTNAVHVEAFVDAVLSLRQPAAAPANPAAPHAAPTPQASVNAESLTVAAQTPAAPFVPFTYN